MTAQELKEFFDGTGVRPIEVAVDQGIDPSVISNYMRGVRVPIPDEFVERLLEYAVGITEARARSAKEARSGRKRLVAATH